MSLSKLSGLHPAVRDAAVFARDVAQAFGVPVEFTSGYRSCTFQRELRARWEAGKSEFPANRPGFSGHNFGLAFDSTTRPEFQPFWNAVREWVGFRVPPNDQIHAEVRDWPRFVELGRC